MSTGVTVDSGSSTGKCGVEGELPRYLPVTSLIDLKYLRYVTTRYLPNLPT